MQLKYIRELRIWSITQYTITLIRQIWFSPPFKSIATCVNALVTIHSFWFEIWGNASNIPYWKDNYNGMANTEHLCKKCTSENRPPAVQEIICMSRSPACTEQQNTSLTAYILLSYLSEPLPVFALSLANPNLSTLFLVKINDIEMRPRWNQKRENFRKLEAQCKHSFKAHSTDIQQHFLWA